jgi:hypothetical protein
VRWLVDPKAYCISICHLQPVLFGDKDERKPSTAGGRLRKQHNEAFVSIKAEQLHAM